MSLIRKIIRKSMSLTKKIIRKSLTSDGNELTIYDAFKCFIYVNNLFMYRKGRKNLVPSDIATKFDQL